MLLVLLAVLLVPFYFGSWKVAVVGLSAQGILLFSLAALGAEGQAPELNWLELVDLLVVRGLAAPLVLALGARGMEALVEKRRSPPNLVVWTLAFGLVLGAFTFAPRLAPEAGSGQVAVAVAIAAVMLALLVLSTQTGTMEQMTGVLRLENAVALLELGADHHTRVAWLQVGQLTVLVLTLAVFSWVLAKERAPEPAPETPEGPSL